MALILIFSPLNILHSFSSKIKVDESFISVFVILLLESIILFTCSISLFSLLLFSIFDFFSSFLFSSFSPSSFISSLFTSF
jgi:hypothetical protein